MTADIDPRVIRRLADMHAVYRMFDRAGRLLYVGVTGHARRFDQHGVKRWFPAVASITLEWHDTEASARVSERRAIQSERPRYNIAGRPKRAKERPALAAEPTSPPERNLLGEVLKAFGDARALHWVTLAERLGTTRDAISVQCRALGVRSTDVREPGGRLGMVRKGCHRTDVETAAARLIVTG